MIVTAKELSLLMDCSERTAEKYLHQISEKYNTPYPTKWHVMEFLCLDWYALEISWQIRICKNEKRAFELLEIRENRKISTNTRKNLQKPED